MIIYITATFVLKIRIDLLIYFSAKEILNFSSVFATMTSWSRWRRLVAEVGVEVGVLEGSMMAVTCAPS